jgi:hypothetical protein
MQTLPELLGPAVAQLGQAAHATGAVQQVELGQSENMQQSLAASEAQTRVLESIRDVLAARQPQEAASESHTDALAAGQPAALTLEPTAQALIQELVQQMTLLGKAMADSQQAMTQAVSQAIAQATAQAASQPAGQEQAEAGPDDLAVERDPAQDARRARQTAKAVRESLRSLPARDKNVEVVTARHDMAPIEVRVVNKVPATFLYLLRAQFDLMRGWLDPLTKVNQHQDEQLYEIRKSLELMTQRYEKIITGLDAQHQGEEDKPH